MRNNNLLQIAAAVAGLIAVVLFGTMKGEQTALYRPILAMLIIGFLFVTVLAIGRNVFDIDDDYPVTLLGASIFLLIGVIVFIVAMAQGGPVILPIADFTPEQFPGGSCQAERWVENIPFCQNNRPQCDQQRNQCYELISSRGSSINHHCNAAMVFAIIAFFVTIGVMVGQYQYMKEPYEEENDINTGLDHKGLAYGNGLDRKTTTNRVESKVFIEHKRDLDSPRPSAFI